MKLWRNRVCGMAAMMIGLAMAASAGAETYYVSPKGSDSNSGTSQTSPWKTVAKVDAAKFAPGTSILFLRCGEWHESLVASSSGSTSAPITYAAYGKASDPKPIFWGSDPIKPGDMKAEGGSIRSVDVKSINPTGTVNCVFANDEFMHVLTSEDDVKSTPNSWCLSGPTLYINTAGAPGGGKVQYTVSSRDNIIFSNGKDNLVFQDLVAKESAHVIPGQPANVQEAYAIRVMNSSNVKMTNCEAYNGGKHHFGVIDSTGFVGKGLYAAGSIPGLPYGNCSALVSYSDPGRHGDTSEWIDCKVDHFEGSQQSFYTHGEGMGSVLIENLTSIGCGMAMTTDNPNETIMVKGGLIQDNNFEIYGMHTTVDGLKVLGRGAGINVRGNNDTIENCTVDGPIQNMGHGNTIGSNNKTK